MLKISFLGTLEVILKVSYKAAQAIRIVVFGCAGYTHLHRKIRLTQLCVELGVAKIKRLRGG